MQINDICKQLEKIDSTITLNEEDNFLLIDSSKWEEISGELASHKDFLFDYLMCITSYDLGGGKLGLVYNLHSTSQKHSLEIKIEFESNIEIPSATSIWRSADWHEREAYDMMGVIFTGHPDMKRILLSDDWEGYPLRKDYKEPDYYRGVPVPKDKTAWE